MSTFGIKTSPQHTTYQDILPVWLEADQIEIIDHAWLFDHFAPIQGDLDGPCLEGWTALAALAQATKRLRLGLMVTGNTYRHPAVLAKIAATAMSSPAAVSISASELPGTSMSTRAWASP